MTVLLSWLRLELRRRWRSLGVLALLVAVSAAVVMTSVAAARRGASALTRLHERTLPASVGVLANTPGFDWSRVRALPEVAAFTNFVVDYQMEIDGTDGNGVGFPFTDANFGSTLEHPVVFTGRMFDPARADEVVVTRKFVSSYHKGVGDTVTLRLPSAETLAKSFTGNSNVAYDGPVITLHIVGVVVSPWLSDGPDSPGGLQVSPGLVAKYPLETIGKPGPQNTQFVNALIRLRDESAAGRVRFRQDLDRVTGRNDLDVLDLVAQRDQLQHQVDFESRCLLAFGAAAFVAALFLVGQAITRYAAASSNELHTLRALGMTPAQSTATSAAAPAVVGVAGATLGAVGAWFASRWFPFGLARYFEPSPGREVDWLVLGSGAVAVAVLVALGAAGAARLALGATRAGAVPRRSAVAGAVARSGAGVPVIVGARFALEAGRGRTSVPVRPALIGAVTGVLGVVAAYTFSHGVSDAATHPERFGQTFQLGAFIGLGGQDYGPAAKVDRVLAGDSRVLGFDDTRSAVATGPDGKATVSLWEYERTAKPIHVVVFDGHLPEAADEVMLAPQTMTALHAHVGATVTLVGSTKVARPLRVSGVGLVPEGPHNGYADGGWIGTAGYDSLFTGFKFHLILITIPRGKDVSATAAALAATVNKALPELHGGADIEPGQVPTEVAEIRQVRTLPVVLGGFLALLAIGAVGHALATAVRRRSHDLAVLRAVGMTPWQCRGVVVTQATVLALAGLVFGIPLGLALGRTVWRVVADYTPLQYVAPLAAVALLLVVPGALLLANLLAAWPGRRAARLQIARTLRAE